MFLCVSSDYFDALSPRPRPGLIVIYYLENVLSQALGDVWYSKTVECQHQKHPAPVQSYNPLEAIMNGNGERVW